MSKSIAYDPRVEDATEGVEFLVSRKHVKGSVVGDPHSCAGSCALRDMEDVKDAWVMRSRTFLLMEDGRILRFLNPTILQRAVENFDGSAGLFPEGIYHLRPVTPSQKSDAVRKRNARRPDGGNRKPASPKGSPRRKLRPQYVLR
jgi:hypothetical protein